MKSYGPQNTLGRAAVGRTLRVTVTASNAGGSSAATSNATPVVGPAPAPKVPKVSVQPEITGVPQEGLALSTSTGTWSNTPTLYGYQWRRCDAGGAGCNSIEGATGRWYRAGPADVGHTLRVVVAAWNDEGGTYTRTDPTPVVAPRPAALLPRNVVPPSIEGSFQTGNTLEVTGGSWSGDPSRWTYQWRRCGGWSLGCENIHDATGATYVVDRADAFQCVGVVVTAWNAGGSSSVYVGVRGLHCAKSAPTPD